MSERLGLVSYERLRQAMFLPEGFSFGKNYSEAKAAEIDEEVARLVDEAHLRVRPILTERPGGLDDLARLLSEKESVQGEELRKMLSAASSELPGSPEKTNQHGNINFVACKKVNQTMSMRVNLL